MTLTLPAYAIGPDLAASMLALDSSQFRTAMKTAVDVLTGRAERMPGRDAHRLRTADHGVGLLLKSDQTTNSRA